MRLAMKVKARTKKKTPNDYPRLSLRLGKDLLDRLSAVKAASEMSLGQIVTICLKNHLPSVESKHSVYPQRRD